jgi:hypothetical protein
MPFNCIARANLFSPYVCFLCVWGFKFYPPHTHILLPPLLSRALNIYETKRKTGFHEYAIVKELKTFDARIIIKEANMEIIPICLNQISVTGIFGGSFSFSY